jgi:hypothetical protein
MKILDALHPRGKPLGFFVPINGLLEEKLIQAYLHAGNLKGIRFEDLKKVFDACDRQKLKRLKPLP